MTEDTESGGRILAATLLDSATLLLFACLAAPPPAEGRVAFGGEPERAGRFRVLSWPCATGGGDALRWCLVRIALDDIGGVNASPIDLIADAGADGGEEEPCAFRLPDIGRIQVEPDPLLAHLRPAAQGRVAAIADFLEARDGEAAEPAGRFLVSFLHTVSQLDGFIEIFGALDGPEFLMQGWSSHLGAGVAGFYVEDERRGRHSAVVATYDRADLGAAGHGIVAVVHQDVAVDTRAIRRLYFRRGEVCCRLDIFDNRMFLDAAGSARHLRDLLPALRMDPATAPAFKRLAVARFEGHETLSGLDAPVRAAVDLALHAPEAGIFLAGWMLDPEMRVSAVNLRSSTGFVCRVDDRWSRVARGDVSAGYASDPLFAGRLYNHDHDHGYLVLVPHPEPGAESVRFHLELVLADEERAFIPIDVCRTTTTATLRGILASFNVEDLGAERIVAAQIGPIVTASARRLPHRWRSRVVGTFGGTGGRRRVSAVIPVPVGRSDFDLNLARFAVDADFAAVELVVVAGPGTVTAMGSLLRRYADFYGLSGRLVRTSEDIDYHQALECGAQHASAELVLFLSSSVLARQAGWLARLESALAAHPSACAAAPTVLYEDNSIKFAGAPVGQDWVPAPLSGYARHWLNHGRGAGPMTVHAVTCDCCLTVRRSFHEVGGFAKDYVGTDFKDLDLSLKFRAARRQCLWVPGIEMVACDDTVGAGDGEYWVQTGRLVDRWGFDRKWSQFLVQGRA